MNKESASPVAISYLAYGPQQTKLRALYLKGCVTWRYHLLGRKKLIIQ